MGGLRVELFGGLRTYVDNQPYTGEFRTQKSRELFAFLVLNRDRAWPRLKLADLLWEERPETDARNNLRGNLSDIRNYLRHGGIDPDRYLLVRSDEVSFGASADLSLDVADFERYFEELAEGPAGPLSDEEAVRLTEAVALCRGDLLDGLYADWCLVPREALRDRFLAALYGLMKYHEAHARWPEAIAHGKRLLGEDLLMEHVYRDLMRCHYLAGDRPSALRLYKTLARRLKEELDVPPMDETAALAANIRNENRSEIQNPFFAVTRPEPVSHPKESRDQVPAMLSNLQAARNHLRDSDVKLTQAIQTIRASVPATGGRPKTGA